MIKFFRKIRHRLLLENRLRRYLLYSIGEIVLVVIGILIALQINNWNENRKLRKSEQLVLTQMLRSLESDLGRTEYIYKYRALAKEQAIHSLINNLNKEKLPHDSLLRPDFFKLTMTLSFTYDKGAYESLKSRGLEIVQNDSLRQRIVRVYENDLPLGVIFIDNDRDLHAELRRSYILELTDYNFKPTEKGQWKGVTDIDFEKIKDSKALKNLIRLEASVASNYKRRLEDKISDFEGLILHIRDELSNRK